MIITVVITITTIALICMINTVILGSGGLVSFVLPASLSFQGLVQGLARIEGWTRNPTQASEVL